MDCTKKAIAHEVQSHLLHMNHVTCSLNDEPHDIEIHTSEISPLVTSIRVPTAGGPRYFEVIVKEKW